MPKTVRQSMKLLIFRRFLRYSIADSRGKGKLLLAFAPGSKFAISILPFYSEALKHAIFIGEFVRQK